MGNLTVAELLGELVAAGAGPRAVGDRLCIAVPPDQLPPELLARARAAKPELIALLRHALTCTCCSSTPARAEIGGFDLAGWRCNACLTEAGLLAAGERAVAAPDALADPAELMLRPGGLT